MGVADDRATPFIWAGLQMVVEDLVLKRGSRPSYLEKPSRLRLQKDLTLVSTPLHLTILERVYVDAREENRIVALRPKPTSQALFQIATMKKDSDS
jgi:hypothetical protein